MTTERRSGQDRRTPPGHCAACRHSASDHLEGHGQCQTADCACGEFVLATRPVPKKRKPAVARKKR